MSIIYGIKFKLRNFLNLFKHKEQEKLDKISDYYRNLSKKPPKINTKK